MQAGDADATPQTFSFQLDFFAILVQPSNLHMALVSCFVGCLTRGDAHDLPLLLAMCSETACEHLTLAGDSLILSHSDGPIDLAQPTPSLYLS